MALTLAIDQGTTSSRSILFDEGGRTVAVAQREFRQIFPSPGLVEHDPEEIWSSQHVTIEAVMREASVSPAEIGAVGITNQRETVVVWDRRTGAPIHNAIVWQDRRTADLCETLREAGLARAVRDRTGLEIDPYFSGTKLRWILDHVPGARATAQEGRLAFGTVDTWLIWKLTGGAVHATDASNASRTMLFDLNRGEWSPAMLASLGISTEGMDDIPGLLPEVRDSLGSFGECGAGTSLHGVPISAVLGDQQAALFGQRCEEAGLAKCTYGTGAFLLANTGDRPRNSDRRLLSTVSWRRDGVTSYALEGSVFAAGAVVQWLRDGLGVIASAGEIEELARGVPDAGGVVLVPAFAGLGAPHWDAGARGAVLGLTRGSTRAHLARAALEGIAFQVADLVTAMQADLGAPLRELRVDGGAARNDLLMQMQSDLLGIPVVRAANLESTALGAARAAAVARDLPFGSESGGTARFEPEIDDRTRASRMETWLAAVDRVRTARDP